MTTPNHGLNGQNSSQPRWEINTLRRVSNDPVAWHGTMVTGQPVHVSYRHGILRIEVASPTPGGGLAWQDLLVLRPAYLEEEMELLRRRRTGPDGEGCSLAAERQERHAIADWLALGECRSDRRDKSPRVTFGRLRSVLRLRDERLEYFSRLGLAGGPVRVIVTALGEEATEIDEWRGEDLSFFRRHD